MGIPAYSSATPQDVKRPLFSVKAVVSQAAAKQEMELKGKTDLSDPAVEHWRYLYLCGYETYLMAYERKVRQDAYYEMGKDMARAIRDMLGDDHDSRSNEKLPKLVETEVKLLLMTQHSLDKAFREGWISAMSEMPQETARSICDTVGIRASEGQTAETS
ncbi:hypothetical protein QFC20_007205 [Naganishia adeliensis]|uniref:Uncharacterized protein n=2 Tax=Naganishia adeliensis TaxID=92952 RepID=A0ACC2UVQ4_9TREE|nr:hypothetical protein QFC20_007846 [Naganishia adeliensis]KAJ9093097.1 hypothetical protein QFC20_007205 [Naganishia adeliensis]